MNRRVVAALGAVGLFVLGLVAFRAVSPTADPTPDRLKVPVPVPPPPAPRPSPLPAPTNDTPAEVASAEVEAEQAEPAAPLPEDDGPEASYTPRQHMEAVELAFANQDAELGRWHLLRALEEPDDPLAPFALYKLSWAEYNLGDRDLAIENMERFLEWTEATNHPIYRNLQKYADKDLDRWYEERETDAPYSPGWP